MSGRTNEGTCRGCGKRILWIKTSAGKNMPVDSTLVNYKIGTGGERIVTQSGEVVCGTTAVRHDEADGIGYISHFATCSKAKQFRRK